MPRKDAPEFSYDPKTKLYRKRIKNEEGRWIPVYGKTKTEIRENVNNRKADIARKIAEADNPLCYQYFAQWYQIWVPGKGYKHAQSVRNAINNHILPEIGNMRMVDVTEVNLKVIMNNVADKSQSLNKQIIFTLKNTFKTACKSGVIPSDPAMDLKAGGNKPAEKVPLTPKQQETLLKAVMGTRIYPFVFIALYTGLRREELLGLQWDCVYLDAEYPYISVQRSVQWKNNRPILSTILKSDAAYRDIPLAPELVTFLKAEKEKSTGDYVISGKYPLTETGFRRRWELIENRSVGERTVVDKDGNEHIVVRTLGEKIRNHNIIILIDFDVTPHLLRHTYITRLILNGVNIKVVQYLAGHATVDITLNIYTHLMENRPEEISESVLAALVPQQDLAPSLAPEEDIAPDLASIIGKYMPVLTQIFADIQTAQPIDSSGKVSS